MKTEELYKKFLTDLKQISELPPIEGMSGRIDIKYQNIPISLFDSALLMLSKNGAYSTFLHNVELPNRISVRLLNY